MTVRKSQKRPVLTSPWKIGLFVALMLTVTSFGVGYYFVKMYNLELGWLETGWVKWGSKAGHTMSSRW